MINALNRNYNRIISLPVKYINLPKDRVIAGELPRSIQTEIKASGAKLLFILFKGQLKEIPVDVDALTHKKSGHQVAVATQSLVGSMSRLLNSEVELLKVKPDSIYFNFGKAYQKVVPVKANLQVNFSPQFSYTEKVQITPAFVSITGDSSLVNKIDSITTEKLVLNKLNKNISQSVDLVLPEELNARVALSVNKVQLSLSIDKYTESAIELPLSVINLPAGYQLKTFPDKVQVKYQVAMGSYEKIGVTDFSAIIDYAKIDRTKPKVRIELRTRNPQVKIIKVAPEKAEYIIRK